MNWCTEEEKLHDQIVLFQPLFLNLILDISFEYFQPQRVLIKNWTCKTKITRNWSKNFHFHRRCKSFWGKFYQKIFQVSSGLFSYLPLPRTQKMATRASILVPSRHSGFFGKYGLRPLFLHSWPHFHPANNGKCRPSRSVNIPPPAHRWYIYDDLSWQRYWLHPSSHSLTQRRTSVMPTCVWFCSDERRSPPSLKDSKMLVPITFRSLH